jgi:AcrR family transcriptional regulator
MVDAALEIVAETGVEGITVQAVVERAKASVGSFYARFAGKEELIVELEERVWNDARRRWDAAVSAQAWDGLSLVETVALAVRLLQDSGRVSEGARRGLRVRVGGAARERTLAAHTDLILEELILRREEDILHPDPALAVDVGLRAVQGVLKEDGERPGPQRTEPDEELAQELTTLLLSYLTAPRAGDPAPAGPGRVDYFDVWG